MMAIQCAKELHLHLQTLGIFLYKTNEGPETPRVLKRVEKLAKNPLILYRKIKALIRGRRK